LDFWCVSRRIRPDGTRESAESRRLAGNIVCSPTAAFREGGSVRRLVFALVCVLVSIEAGGQEPPTVFRTGVDLVALNVVVTDRREQLVRGLASRDFVVLENGVPQDVTFFAASDVPLDLALLVDTSGSMATRLPIVHEAATQFLRTLRPGDRAMVVDIKNSAKTLQPLGSDIDQAIRAVRATGAGGGTGLFNAVYTTLKELVRTRQRHAAGEIRRQAIVVLSDGMDTASLISFDDVMEVARHAGVATYTITVRSRFSAQAGRSTAASPSEFSMKTLAEETGARAFFPRQITDLATVYGEIAAELASQYAMGYMPKTPAGDGDFRRIVVQVPERPGSRARTRSGYTAGRPPQGVS
jgi:Ca-activated chloride channel family protein